MYEKTKHLDVNKIQEVLYNNEKFNKLGLYKSFNATASTFYELLPDQQFVIYDLERISRLEIKMKNKNRIKLFLKNIVAEELLFPIYNFNAVLNPFSDEAGLIVMENDIGNFGQCVINSDIFDFNALYFDIFKIDLLNKSFISKIHYNEQELLFKKKDSLFNGRVHIIKN
ncbi:MAG: hypothetical protein Q8L90_04715 [Bacteroidota bacterium]|nr:hypothetical protein [Bacteroidota bacterium]